MKVIFFGNSDCKVCNQWIKEFQSEKFPSKCADVNIEFLYVDAMAKETEKMCDDLGIDGLPHVKIYDSDNRIIWDKIGYNSKEDSPSKLWEVFYPDAKIRKEAKELSSGLKKTAKSKNGV